MIYQIVLINGRALLIEADEYECEDGVYKFYLNGEVVGEFLRNNIAGFCRDDEV